MASRSPAVYRRRRFAVFGTTGLTVGVLSGLLVIGSAPLPEATVTPLVATDLTSAPAELAVPPFGSTVISADGYGVLFEQNADTPAPIASMAKVITALVILDAHPIEPGTDGPQITFDADDVDALARSVQNAESRADVVEGMSLSLRDALTVMLVESANNYAWTLARWAFGSEESYVARANEWLGSQGFSSTVVADASGLSPSTMSTPRDLIGIGTRALDNEVTSRAVSTTTTTIDPMGEIDNGNRLLGTLGVNGIKTGTTDEAGACLLFSSHLPIGETTVRVIGVTLGAPDHISLSDALSQFLSSIQRGFHVVTPALAGSEMATASTAWGAETALRAEQTVTRIVWSDTPVTVTTPTRMSPTGSSTSTATSATLTVGDETIAVPLSRVDALEDPGLAWRVSHLDLLFAG